MYPVFLDLTDRLVLVVGGGPVGRRKLAGLIEAAARIRLVCREPAPEGLSERATWLQADYTAGHLDGVCLAIAAGPVSLNKQVIADARARGIWALDTADPDAGDFHVPAVLRRGQLTLAISTGGVAPHLAARLRDRLADQFDPAYADWLELLAEMRVLLREQVYDQTRRRELMINLCEDAWLERLRVQGQDEVRRAMREIVAS